MFKSCAKGAFVVAALVWGMAASAERLPGSEWGPTELNGEGFTPVSEIFLQFEQDGRVFGHGGCNTFRGSFVTNEDAILFSPVAMTQMACPPEISQQEFDFTAALMTVRLFERDGISLMLSNSEGDVVLRMTQRDAD